MKKKLAIFLCTIALVFSVSGNVWATPCDYGGIFDCSISGSLSLSSDCRDGGDKNDAVLDFNDGNYFGFNDWEYLSKINLGGNLEGLVDIDLAVTPTSTTGTLTGTFYFNPNTWLLYDNIAIVLKGGSQIISGVKWSAYLLNTGVYEGCWDYDDGSKDLSHLSVYGTPGTPVPEPATLLLLGSGLIGLAGIGRKKFFKKA